MTAEELTTVFQERGFDYLSSTKALGYLNDAYLVDICEAEDWPFLEETTSGVAPLTISNLRSVEYVIDSTQGLKLAALDRRAITDSNYNISEAGTPRYYYLTTGTVLNVYPANTSDTLSVRYYKTPTKLTGQEVPVLPERFHSLIIDGAVSRAYEDSDDYELAQSASVAFQARLQTMRFALMDNLRDGPDEFVQITNYGAF